MPRLLAIRYSTATCIAATIAIRPNAPRGRFSATLVFIGPSEIPEKAPRLMGQRAVLPGGVTRMQGWVGACTIAPLL